ncbi:hypothetical protein [Streptomyces finlayi]|uniref:hypothetical protein n=1 Tax=Streptomyces finlayi TaxID=67296 RepID=UPI0035BC8675
MEGQIPAARERAPQQLLPELTRGEGVLESTLAQYHPVTGPVPDRPRTDNDLLHRKEYLLRTLRRVAAGACARLLHERPRVSRRRT